MSVNVSSVDDQTFDIDVLKSDLPVLVDFGASWCAPCRALEPVVSAIADAYQGQLKVRKLDVDHNEATAGRYGIRGIPALLLFKDGKIMEQIVGFVPQVRIEEAIVKLLG